MSTLESSAIRHLILKAKLTGRPQSQLQMGDIVRTVVDMAVKQGLLREAPHLYVDSQLEGKISAVIPESGAFSLAKRGPRGELAAIRGDFGILSLT